MTISNADSHSKKWYVFCYITIKSEITKYFEGYPALRKGVDFLASLLADSLRETAENSV